MTSLTSAAIIARESFQPGAGKKRVRRAHHGGRQNYYSGGQDRLLFWWRHRQRGVGDQDGPWRRLWRKRQRASALPVGVFEVGPSGTHFVAVGDKKKLLGTLLPGSGTGSCCCSHGGKEDKKERPLPPVIRWSAHLPARSRCRVEGPLYPEPRSQSFFQLLRMAVP